MRIKSISIIGLGLIGGSIAKALRNSGLQIEINAFDRDDTLNTAISENVIDKKLSGYEDALNSDLIFLCLPIKSALDVFMQLVPKLGNNILTDVCSVKLVFQEHWEKLNTGKGIYIGGHPMTGKEKAGYRNSDPLLFENTTYILTQDLKNRPELEDFRKIIEALGANILYIPPKQHDVIAASVSHLPQLTAVALVNTASLKTENYNFLDLAAGGFRDMTRIASSDFAIWESIISTNRKQILTALEKFSFEIDKLIKWISGNKIPELANYFSEARKNRDEIPQNTKGFLTPVYDIFIFVEDKPGMISKISTALYENGINIKDIELLKIREGTGGTFRLSFESSEEASKAKAVIKETGFKVSE